MSYICNLFGLRALGRCHTPATESVRGVGWSCTFSCAGRGVALWPKRCANVLLVPMFWHTNASPSSSSSSSSPSSPSPPPPPSSSSSSSPSPSPPPPPSSS
eukprot:15855953-Heterocapsa_arctica.AAC.1